MLKILFLLVITYAICRFFFRLMYLRVPPHMHKDYPGPRHQSSNANQTMRTVKEELVPSLCAVCNKEVGADDAIKKGELTFCSAAHLSVYAESNLR